MARILLTYDNKPLILERYTIGGLIWGNEFVWADKQGQVICIITNDAEFDKFEAVRAAYEDLLPNLIGKNSDLQYAPVYQIGFAGRPGG